MYYAVGHYRYVKHTFGDKELLQKKRQDVSENIQDMDVRASIGKEQTLKFCIFKRNPAWYDWCYKVGYEDTVSRKAFRKGIRWLEKL